MKQFKKTGALPMYESLYESSNVFESSTMQLVAARRLQARVAHVLKAYGLNATQWAILGRLREKQQGVRSTDLASFLDVKLPLITIMTKPLIGKGLIQRNIQKGDRRAKILRITDQALQVARTIDGRIEEQMRQLFGGITPSELSAYFNVLRRLSAPAEIEAA